MKIRILIGALLGVLIMACSSDDGDNGRDSIVGTWDLASVDFDGNTQEEQALELLFDLLAAQDCSLITMIFEQDGQATLQTSLAYLDLEGMDLANPVIDCPRESDSESAAYSYEDGQLSITDSEGITSVIGATLSGDRLTVDLEGSEFEEVGVTGSMTFERR